MKAESGNHLVVYENGHDGEGLPALEEALCHSSAVLEKRTGDLIARGGALEGGSKVPQAMGLQIAGERSPASRAR